MRTKEQVAKTIDHAALKPAMVNDDIIKACETGIKHKVASVCVRPTDVSLAKKQLAGTGVDVSVVVGFPHGSNRSEVKALEAKLAIEDGAVELDMVMNIGKFLSGEYDYVQNDITAVVNEARKKNVIVKVILETCYLSPAQIAKACELAKAAGANFVKTSTGFGIGSATPEAVDVMIKTVGDSLGVKASGGIRNFDTAVAFLEQGCTRLGAGATDAILNGTQSNEKY